MRSSLLNIISIILEGLEGSFSLKLNDAQLNGILTELKESKDLPIKYVQCQDGYVEVKLGIPLIPKVKVHIEAIDINSKKLVLSVRFANIGSHLLTPLLQLFNKPGIKVVYQDGLVLIDATEKWKTLLKGLSKEAVHKMDMIETKPIIEQKSFEIKLKLIEKERS